MCKTRVQISFDDGCSAQYKWARWMAEADVPGVFYVCPGLLDGFDTLSLETLEKIAALGHRIGNHTWGHEAPSKQTWPVVLESIQRCQKWLDERGWDGQALALTYGSRGGGWLEVGVCELHAQGFVTRDVRFVGEPIGMSHAALLLGTSDSVVVPGVDNYFYAHGNHETTDDAFCAFLQEMVDARDAGKLTFF